MDDTEAVALAQAGSPEAFRCIVERHGRRVFRLAYRMTGNEQDAEDVVQETFLRAYRRLDGFEGRADVGSWLYRIAANCAYDLLRGRGRRPLPLEPTQPEDPSPLEAVADGLPGPDRQLLSRELQARIQAVMARMSDLERSVFVMRHFEGLSTSETARALGLNDSAVKQGVFRAVRKLRGALEGIRHTATVAAQV